jgi:hypothetical protein
MSSWMSTSLSSWMSTSPSSWTSSSLSSWTSSSLPFSTSFSLGELLGNKREGKKNVRTIVVAILEKEQQGRGRDLRAPSVSSQEVYSQSLEHGASGVGTRGLSGLVSGLLPGLFPGLSPELSPGLSSEEQGQ